MKRWSELGSKLLTFSANEDGAIIIFFSALLPFFIALAAFAVDLNFAYGRRGGMQAAADSAALAGAMEIALQNPSGSVKGSTHYVGIMQAAINQAYGTLSYAGFVNGGTNGNRSVTVDAPTIDDSAAPYTVTVSLRETGVFDLLRMASTLLGSNYTSTVIGAHAKARASNAGDNCIISLAKTGSGSITGNGSLTLGTPNGCGVASDSSDPCALSTTGSSAVIAAPVNLVGGSCVTGNPPPLNISYGYPTPDPYNLNGTKAALGSYIQSVTPNSSPSCTSTSGSASTKSCVLAVPAPGVSLRQPGNADWGTHGTLTLQQGVYVFDSLSIGSGQTLTSSGHATVIVRGNSTVSAGATVNLQAPTTGNFAGIAFACLGTCTTLSFQGGPNFKGSVYAPNAAVDFGGNPSSACIQLIANTISLSGNVTLNDNCPEISVRSSRFGLRLIQ